MQIETQAEAELEVEGGLLVARSWARNMQCSRWQTMAKGENRRSEGEERARGSGRQEKARVKVTLHCYPGRGRLLVLLLCLVLLLLLAASSFWPSTQLLKDKLASSSRGKGGTRGKTAYKLLHSKSHNNLGQTSKLHSV